MSLSTSIHDLKTLILSHHPVIVMETLEEDRANALLREVARDLEKTFFEWSVAQGLIRIPDARGSMGTADPAKLLMHLKGLTVDAIYHLKDFSVHLRDPAVTRHFREVAQKFFRKGSSLVLTGVSIELPAEVEHKAAHYELKLPGRDELADVVRSVASSLRAVRDIRVDLRRQEHEELLRALGGLTLNQARQVISYGILEDGELSAADVENVLERKVQIIRDGGLLEYFPLEDNRFQLGGFARLKAWLERAAVGFSEQARDLNLAPPRGILIVGVQGCGKSLTAKYLAREWKLPLLKLDAGRLFDKYIGESEKNFRKAISLAEAMAPTVLWIDEIEKGLAPAGGDADAGLSRRLFGAFLTWLQEKREQVFVAATANDISMLPPELLRKGRFDEIFFVDLPGPEERDAIFRIHLALRKQDPAGFDLARLVEATDGFSGAEIEQAVIASLYRALHRKTALGTELLLAEIADLIPLSISRREDIETLRETARGRFLSVH